MSRVYESENLPPGALTLDLLQREQSAWQNYNFGDQHPDNMVLGLVEEVGELAHHLLKLRQGIRGTRAQHMEGIRDSLADAIIYMCGLASSLDVELQVVVEETWAKVRTRDWIQYPQTGRPPSESTEVPIQQSR